MKREVRRRRIYISRGERSGGRGQESDTRKIENWPSREMTQPVTGFSFRR